VGVFASGRGSNFKALAERCADPAFSCVVACLITDDSSAPAIAVADAFQIPVHVIDAGPRLGIGPDRRRIGLGFGARSPRADVGDHRLRRGDAGARMSGDLGGARRCSLFESVAVGYHLRHEPDAQRLGGVDPAPGEQQLAGVSAAEDVEEPRDAIARVEAERDFGKPELCRLRGDAKVLGRGEHASATQRIAAHGSNGDLGEAREAVHDPLPPLGQRLGLDGAEARHLGDVIAGAERAPAAAHDHRRDVAGAIEDVEPVLESIRRPAVEGIERLRALEGEASDSPIDDEARAHRRRSVLSRSLSEKCQLER
jgi:hypothetical protein